LQISHAYTEEGRQYDISLPECVSKLTPDELQDLIQTVVGIATKCLIDDATVMNFRTFEEVTK
jgi:hypothetical protein